MTGTSEPEPLPAVLLLEAAPVADLRPVPGPAPLLAQPGSGVGNPAGRGRGDVAGCEVVEMKTCLLLALLFLLGASCGVLFVLWAVGM